MPAVSKAQRGASIDRGTARGPDRHPEIRQTDGRAKSLIRNKRENGKKKNLKRSRRTHTHTHTSFDRMRNIIKRREKAVFYKEIEQ